MSFVEALARWTWDKVVQHQTGRDPRPQTVSERAYHAEKCRRADERRRRRRGARGPAQVIDTEGQAVDG